MPLIVALLLVMSGWGVTACDSSSDSGSTSDVDANMDADTEESGGGDTESGTGGSRDYTTPVFDDFSVTTLDYRELSASGQITTLTLDFYEPQGDTSVARPLLLFVTGGGFDQPTNHFNPYAEAFAYLGYTSAILGFRPKGGAAVKNTVNGISDMRAAIRFFRDDAAGENKYRVSPDDIYPVGHSSGAFAVLIHSYVTRSEEVSGSFGDAMLGSDVFDDFPTESSTRACVAFSGALPFIDAVEATDPPCLHLYGDRDFISPDSGMSLAYGVEVHGSNVICKRATSLGLPSRLYVQTNGDHFSIVSMNCTSCVDEMIDFMAGRLSKNL